MKQFGYSDTSEAGSRSIGAQVFLSLSELANAATWQQTRQVLLQYQTILLSDAAITLVQQMIAEYEAEGDRPNTLNWQQYLNLLEDARNHGVHGAWNRFKLRQLKAANAHDALVSASTPALLHEALERYQTALCSDSLRVMLYETMAQERSAGKGSTAQHVERLIRLLDDCCASDLAMAWKRFLDEA